MNRWLELFLAVLLGPAGCAAGEEKAFPATVLLVRHAEKPPDADESIHLSAEGKKRADALPGLFEASKARPDPLPKPDFVFATESSKHSHRPAETAEPLAKALDLKVRTPVKNEDFAKLAKHVLTDPKYAGKTVLICWHHGTMPQLARALGATDAPGDWKGSAFDRVWRIDFGDGGKVNFRDLPQKLLPGDAKK